MLSPRHSIVWGLVLAAALLSAAHAAPITQLVATGTNLLNGVDQSWTLTQNPENPGQSTAYLVTSNVDTPFPFFYKAGAPGFGAAVWALNDANSSWLSNRKCAGVASNETNCTGELPFGVRGSAPGNYMYSIDFDLTGLRPSTAMIQGQWMSDGLGAAIYLNGIRVDAPNMLSSTFASFTGFQINTAFRAGLNTLSFEINNLGDVAGFRATLAGTASPVPEPSSYLLMSVGAGALLYLGRRRRV
jgi:hypothetical protein